MGKILVPDDIPDPIKARVIVEEVIGVARPKYKMRQLCRVMNVDVLQLEVPIATELTGQEKVPALVEAELSAQAYEALSFSLWKNVVHIAVAKETELRAPFEVMRMNVQDAAKEVARMENGQIDTVLTGNLTGIGGGDWGAKTGGVSDNSPLDDIGAAISAIEDFGYEANILALSPKAYSTMIANTHITTILERGFARTTRLPSLAGLKIVTEPQMLDTEAYVVDSTAPVALLADGPNMVIQYSGNAAFFDAYAVAKFLEPKFVTTVGARAGRKLTGITT